MYQEIDDDDVLGAYLPSANPKAEIIEKNSISIPTTPTIRLQDARKPISTSTQPNINITEGTPRVFSPAGFSPAIKSQSKSYGARTRSKDVFFRYNCKEATTWEPPKQSEWTVNANPFGFPIFKAGFKYMFQRTGDSSRTMDDMIENLSSTILDYNKIDKEGKDLKESSAEDLHYVGRIRGDGKLSVSSTFFEGTQSASNGHIVTLDLSQLEEYFLFPGQVLALEGKNNLGKCVAVSKMFYPRPLPFPDKPVRIDSRTGPLRLLVAAGPYTTTDSLVFEPLADLVTEIEKNRPHFCILIGPFLDSTHPMIERGDVSDTFEDIFNQQITYLSESVSKIDANCKLVLVSTNKDVHHHPVFPTPPYSVKELKNVITVPDPAMISINGVIIGITSVDIIKHLGGHELSQSMISPDRMGRLVRHLLCQRNFYPLYPPDESVPLDIIHWSENAHMSCTPHILILPSDLRHFIKDVDGTIVVNPERLTKGVSGGTFAKLQLDLSDQDTDEFRGPIADFVMGEIIKI